MIMIYFLMRAQRLAIVKYLSFLLQQTTKNRWKGVYSLGYYSYKRCSFRARTATTFIVAWLLFQLKKFSAPIKCWPMEYSLFVNDTGDTVKQYKSFGRSKNPDLFNQFKKKVSGSMGIHKICH